MQIFFLFVLSVMLFTGLSACQIVDNFLVGIGGSPQPRSAVRSIPFTVPTPLPEKLSYPDLYPLPFTAKNRQYLARWDGERWQDFYIKGINLGVGVPGTQADDLAVTREQYARWLRRIGEMGFNSLRIYTLHFPHFYEEFARYNASHPDRPIYLFQGIWLDEVEETQDLYASTAAFEASIKEVVNAVHGRATISPRQGRAFGTYTADISRWVMGWIIGREISPEEVKLTDERHAGKNRYEGQNVSISGSPSEVWWAEQVDKLITFERSAFKVERPVSVSSWPTLDPLYHPTENEQYSQEDTAQIDLSKLEQHHMPAGYFASYHAYPYYPDFINDSPEYLKYKDSEGINNYIGYLNHLKSHYQQMPLVIAEYGVPSSWGNAHFSPSGMHHGGHDEVAQGKYNARLTRNIRDQGLAGGILFAWIDEWWKRTWIVDELAMPRSNYRLWHNITSPEENFGMIAFDLEIPPTHILKLGTGRIRTIGASADATFFHLKLELDQPLRSGEELVLGVDTYRDDLGEVILPNGVRTTRRNEFALRLQVTGPARWLVTQPYDLFGIWHNSSGPQQLFQSRPTEGAPWLPVRWQNGQERMSRDGLMIFPITIDPIGELQVRHEGQRPSSRDAVIINGNTIELRLPWTLLQFVDPTTLTVTHDDRTTRVRETHPSEGIAVSVSLAGELIETDRYRWASWTQAPPVKEREKEGVPYVEAVLKMIPDHPD